MKKLMIALAVAALAVASQAAEVKWQSGVLKNIAGTANLADGDVAVKVFYVDSTAYDTYLAAYNKSGDMSAVWTDYKDGKLDSKAVVGTTAYSKGAFNFTDGTGHENEKLYGVVVYTYAEAGKDYYKANIGIADVVTQAKSVGAMGTYYLGDTKGTAMTWQSAAVPEPTSAMLMLLGFAGLALRRRRA